MIQMLLCRLCPWHMGHCSMYDTFNSFDLQSSWMSIIMPSGGNQWEAHQQGQIQGLTIIRATPIIWIKILEASWLKGFNHFDVLLKPASLLLCSKQSCADLCCLQFKNSCVCFFCHSVWADLTDVPHYGQIFMHDRPPTVERELPFHCVHPPGVFSHTFICAGILLLEIWDF